MSNYVMHLTDELKVITDDVKFTPSKRFILRETHYIPTGEGHSHYDWCHCKPIENGSTQEYSFAEQKLVDYKIFIHRPRGRRE